MLAEERAERDADPAGGAGEPAADLVGDAGQRDVTLDDVVALEQVKTNLRRLIEYDYVSLKNPTMSLNTPLIETDGRETMRGQA